MLTNQSDMKAGHLEIHGETIAKFELFDAGFNTYSRYLDVDKIDLITRFFEGKKKIFKEIQVKFGRTYSNKFTKNQEKFFKKTSWKIVDANEFIDTKYNDIFIIYVLADENGYHGDIFIFPIKDYNKILKKIIKTEINAEGKDEKDGRKLYISQGKDDKWYIWKKINFAGIDKLTSNFVHDVQKYRRNFDLIKNKK